jgi:hypothetical protein
VFRVRAPALVAVKQAVWLAAVLPFFLSSFLAAKISRITSEVNSIFNNYRK